RIKEAEVLEELSGLVWVKKNGLKEGWFMSLNKCNYNRKKGYFGDIFYNYLFCILEVIEFEVDVLKG
uniref:hypothetical protein n=1 Tax=Staphylococcus epidermidis TaxID=1282 RepID=UPI001C92C259